jgi:DNA topoisomerase-3
MGAVEKVEFKATGKQIIEPGWRVVYDQQKAEQKATPQEAQKDASEQSKKDNTENIMPHFEEGEKGPHKAEIQEKETRPPKYYTEATLLRAMETAGKNVDDEELREAMKENGIGRPSTRANIIETLFRRRYIEKKKKNIHATVTGVGLIDTIQSDLLKSAELTGQWEHKLRLIEKGEYEVSTFKKELIDMVVDITNGVKSSKGQSIQLADEAPKKDPKSVAGKDCPKCQKGKLLKGKSAYGCSEYKNGCSFVLPFVVMGKKLSDKNHLDLVTNGKTTKLKGIKMQVSGGDGIEKRDGKLVLTEDFNLELE